MKKVTILIPCYNEEASLPILYQQLTATINAISAYSWEILFVDDGSGDATLDVIKRLRAEDPRVCFISLSRNFGKERAMLAGIDHARGDAMIIMDADLQHPPHLISEFIAYWEQGFDDVYARRRARSKESFVRRKLTQAYYSILERSTKYTVLTNVGDFRLLDRKCIESIRQLRETQRYTKGMFCWIGFRKKEVAYDQPERVAGKSSWNLLQLVNLAIDGLTSHTTMPLRISTILGLLCSVGAILYMLYVFIKTLLFGDPVQGFPTLVIIILFLGGLQLFSLGIIGEYLGKIFYETKHRPVYLINEKEGI